MVRKCLHEGCTKYASFNYPGEYPGIRCKNHYNSETMVNVVSTLCEFNNCKNHPTHNFKGLTIRRFCKLHGISLGMIDVKNKTCHYEGCEISPNFNLEGEKKGIFCFKHKTDEMINVKDKNCEVEGCNIKPSFNFLGEQKPICCAKHGKPLGMVDVKSKRCKENGCNNHPSFNYPGNSKREYCVNHRKGNMICVSHKLCKLCKLISSQKQYNFYCIGCYIYLNPEVKISRNYLNKEKTIMSEINKKINEEIKINNDVDFLTVQFNKSISGGISQRRPDLLITFHNYSIIIEIDENQHRYYNASCEEIRTNEIFTDLSYKPLVIIRFNPDKYTLNGEKKMELFKFSRTTGKASIINQEIFNNEIQILFETLKFYIKNTPEEGVTYIYLRYDKKD